jgi:hypothetical protein
VSEAVLVNMRILWHDPRAKGLERLFDTALLLLRLLSISYNLKWFLDGPRRAMRSRVIDCYCVIELVVLVILLAGDYGPRFERVVAAYVLFEIYLNLFNIIFIGTFPAINAPPASVERSILLLFLNVLHVAVAFVVFYEHAFKLSRVDAFFNAVLVLGTLGYPTAAAGWCSLLVSLQIFMDLVLLVLLLSSFVGQVGLFRRDGAVTSTSNEPLQPTGSAGG